MIVHHRCPRQPRTERSRQFQSPEPDLASAEEASEDGQAMHADDMSDWERVEELDQQIDRLNAEQERDHALLARHNETISRHAMAITRVSARVRDRAQMIKDLDQQMDSLRMLIRERHPLHVDGHRRVNGVLEARQRVGKVRIHVASERDVDVDLGS